MQSLLTRESVELGMSRAQLRPGRRWRRLSHGLYVPAELEVDLATSCRAMRRVLPDAVFADFTAAALFGWWLPPLPAGMPLCAALPSAAHPIRRSGVRVRRTTRDSEPHSIDGIPVTTAVRTLLDLARLLCVVDLVIVMDSALRFGHCTAVELSAASQRAGGRGIRTFRRAAALADPHSESAWESMLRLMHVLSGFPDVQPQVNLTDADGAWIARADLWLVGTRRIAEYDGANHRDRDRHRADLAREKRLARAGYERYGYTSRELLGRPGALIRDAEQAFGKEHEPRRVQAWLSEMRSSLFVPAGRERLIRSWRLR